MVVSNYLLTGMILEVPTQMEFPTQEAKETYFVGGDGIGDGQISINQFVTIG